MYSNIAARNLFSEENVEIEKPLQEVDSHVEVASKVKGSSKTPVQKMTVVIASTKKLRVIPQRTEVQQTEETTAARNTFLTNTSNKELSTVDRKLITSVGGCCYLQRMNPKNP